MCSGKNVLNYNNKFFSVVFLPLFIVQRGIFPLRLSHHTSVNDIRTDRHRSLDQCSSTIFVMVHHLKMFLRTHAPYLFQR